MEHDTIICACGSVEHVFIFSYDKDLPNEVYMHIHIHDYPNFFKRIKEGIKYIFGHKSIYGHFDTVHLNSEHYDTFKKISSYIEPVVVIEEKEIITEPEIKQEPDVPSIDERSITHDELVDLGFSYNRSPFSNKNQYTLGEMKTTSHLSLDSVGPIIVFDITNKNASCSLHEFSNITKHCIIMQDLLDFIEGLNKIYKFNLKTNEI